MNVTVIKTPTNISIEYTKIELPKKIKEVSPKSVDRIKKSKIYIRLEKISEEIFIPKDLYIKTKSNNYMKLETIREILYCKEQCDVCESMYCYNF
jgi:hypothetical protein